MLVDELSIYRGKDIKISDKIVLTVPTLKQIEEFGESRYFGAVSNFTAVGADLKWQLWDEGIDYTTISDFELFLKLISQIISSKKYLYEQIKNNPDKYKKELKNIDTSEMLINPISLLFKDLDFADFKPYVKNGKDIILYNKEKDIVFGRYAYTVSVDIIRKIHGLKRNNEMPGNERTKIDMIEDAKNEAMSNKNKPYKSTLLPLISTLQVKCGQCGDNRIWEMPISALFYNVKRIGKIQDAECLLNSAYSGFSSLKGINKDRLNMFGEI